MLHSIEQRHHHILLPITLMIQSTALGLIGAFLVAASNVEALSLPMQRIPFSCSAVSKSSGNSLVLSATTNDDTELAKPHLKVQRYYKTFTWKSHKINYRAEGVETGAPILLVHGFGGNVNHFRYNIPALAAEGFRVYAVDLLGFGASDKPADADYSIELFVALLTDFISMINAPQQWVVAGNSIGGLCSLGVTKNLPDQVRGCVLFNASGGMSGFRYEDVSLFMRPVLWFVQKIVLGPQLGGRFFADFKTRENVEAILKTQGVYGDTTNVDDELLEILLAPSDDEGAKEVFLKVFGGPPGPTPESLLLQIETPILALWGDADPWTPVEKGMHPGTNFHDYAKGAFQLKVLPGVGHCPHDECPDLCHSFMIPWIAAL